MEAVIYFFIFIIGTLFGSFFTLAVYRIPIKQSIMYGRSYCPKCEHKLQFLDLIPVLSYVFLGGKCRYCREKIRPRYILLELLSGFTFLMFALSININIYNLEISKLVYLVFGMLYLSILFIIAGIDKEKHIISNSVLSFGFICELIYIIYLYVLGVSMYKYVIYLFIIASISIINAIIMRNSKKQNYTVWILLLILFLVMFTQEKITIISIIITLFIIAIKQISLSLSNKEITNRTMPIGFYLCICNIITLIIQNYII